MKGVSLVITVSFSDRRHDDASDHLAGKSASEILNVSKALLSIPDGVKVKVNNTDASLDTIVRAGDDIEFIEQSRNKGN
jgi:hypothetical protein